MLEPSIEVFLTRSHAVLANDAIDQTGITVKLQNIFKKYS